MGYTIFNILFSLVCGIAFCEVVSTSPAKGEETAQPLAPISWIFGLIVFVGVNLGLLFVGWTWIPIGILIGLIVAVCVYNFNANGAIVAFIAALPITVTAILCLAKEIDNGTSQVKWLIIIPILELLAIYAIGRLRSSAKDERKQVAANIFTVICIIVAVIAIGIYVKEVLIK
ncbi:hypothetical protein IJI94_00740 [Candidatus Saccharibacteria bacterium]|nr:hypothetical protein [Candidatus Saccharibacteria bacterium]